MLGRIRHSLKSAVHHGQNSWSVAKLRERDPRFDEVWKLAGAIPGWFEEASAIAIFQVLAERRPTHIVEIGSYQGRSTVFFARSLQVLGIPGRVTSIDPHTGDRQQLERLGGPVLPTLQMFNTHIQACGVESMVNSIVATSSEAEKGWKEPFQFLFVDGWHGYDAVLTDGREWFPHLVANGVAVFDDVNYEEVTRAVHDLHVEGTIHLWGYAFNQAYAGRKSDAPVSVRAVLAADRPLTRHLRRHLRIS